MVRKILFRTTLVILISLIGGALFAAHYFGFLFVQLDTDPPSLPANLNRPAILVFSKANGFVHTDALPAGESLLENFAKRNGWGYFATENGAVMTAELLQQFDVVVWNNTSGTTLTEEQGAAFRQYLENGGGFVGLHAAGGDPWYQWQWYVRELIGAQFIGHTMDPQFQDAIVTSESPSNGLTQHLPARWSVPNEEWYAFDQSVRGKGYEVLLSLDESSYHPGNASMGDDHPIAWRHNVGTGRAVYSAIGHQGSTYVIPAYVEFVERAILWAGKQHTAK